MKKNKLYGDITQEMIKRSFSVPVSEDGKPNWDGAELLKDKDEVVMVTPKKIVQMATDISISNQKTLDIAKKFELEHVTLVVLVKPNTGNVPTYSIPG